MEGLYEKCVEAHTKNLIAKKERLTLRDEESTPKLLAVGDIPYEAVAIAALNKLADFEDAEENRTLIRPKGFCCNCQELILHENASLYAECPKVGTKFKPFELDTRTHFCDYFTEKALKERE